MTMATDQELIQAITQVDNVETLRQIFKNVADALRRKGVTQQSIKPEEFPTLIDGIDTVAAGTNDANATADDIANGKTAYVKGSKIIGALQEIRQLNTYEASIDNVSVRTSGSNFLLTYGALVDMIFRGDSYLRITLPLTNFGDAQESDVLAGKRFTSTSGYDKIGTLKSGVDTSDANALATDIASGKVAYSKGERIVGSITVRNSTSTHTLKNPYSVTSTSSKVNITGEFPDDLLFRTGAKITIQSDFDIFGTATAKDVASGKTFTSIEGFKVEGTAVISNRPSVFHTGVTQVSITSCSVNIPNLSSYDGFIIGYFDTKKSSESTIVCVSGRLDTLLVIAMCIDSSGNIFSQRINGSVNGDKLTLLTSGDAEFVPMTGSEINYEIVLY